LERGDPDCVTPPIRYGEPLVFTLPWPDGKTIQSGTLGPDHFPNGGRDLQFAEQNGRPSLNGTVPAVCLESVDGRGKNLPVLAGDLVRLRLLETGGGYVTVATGSTRGVAGTPTTDFTILHWGDNAQAPGQLGEYFLESDKMLFVTGRPGAAEQAIGKQLSPPVLQLTGLAGAVAFSLKRCDELTD
jgi:hypothetical protein